MKLSKFNALMSLSNEQILEAIFTNEKNYLSYNLKNQHDNLLNLMKLKKQSVI